MYNVHVTDVISTQIPGSQLHETSIDIDRWQPVKKSSSLKLLPRHADHVQHAELPTALTVSVITNCDRKLSDVLGKKITSMRQRRQTKQLITPHLPPPHPPPNKKSMQFRVLLNINISRSSGNIVCQFVCFKTPQPEAVYLICTFAS